MALAGLGSAGGDEAEVVEAMLLQPALTTFEIAFEASAILRTDVHWSNFSLNYTKT